MNPAAPDLHRDRQHATDVGHSMATRLRRQIDLPQATVFHCRQALEALQGLSAEPAMREAAICTGQSSDLRRENICLFGETLNGEGAPHPYTHRTYIKPPYYCGYQSYVGTWEIHHSSHSSTKFGRWRTCIPSAKPFYSRSVET